MQLTLGEVTKAVGGRLVSGETESVISGVSTDSRTVKKGELFVALHGEHHDGHDHLLEVFEKEAGGAVVDRDVSEEANVIRVDDTLKALGDLAQSWRERFPVRVVGVTGSNGKTTTKDMIAALLSQKFRVLKTEGNFNNLIGMPHMIFRMDEKTDIAVLEMGMNHPGEIRRLASIARPEVGVITNVARAHLEGLGSVAAIARAKAELLESLPREGLAVLNDRDPSYRPLKKFVRSRLCYFGRASSVRVSLTGTGFTATIRKKKASFQMPILGAHNVTNALAAIAVADHFGVPVSHMKKVFRSLQAGSKRMEVVPLERGIQVIHDCYNANPDSMAASLVFLKAASGKRRCVSVLGEMLELGEASTRLHAEVGRRAAEAKVGLLVGVGPHADEMARGARRAGLASEKVFSFRAIEDAMPVVLALLRPGDLVLMKGSRGMKMEKITETLKNVL